MVWKLIFVEIYSAQNKSLIFFFEKDFSSKSTFRVILKEDAFFPHSSFHFHPVIIHFLFSFWSQYIFVFLCGAIYLVPSGKATLFFSCSNSVTHRSFESKVPHPSGDSPSPVWLSAFSSLIQLNVLCDETFWDFAPLLRSISPPFLSSFRLSLPQFFHQLFAVLFALPLRLHVYFMHFAVGRV